MGPRRSTSSTAGPRPSTSSTAGPPPDDLIDGAPQEHLLHGGAPPEHLLHSGALPKHLLHGGALPDDLIDGAPQEHLLHGGALPEHHLHGGALPEHHLHDGVISGKTLVKITCSAVAIVAEASWRQLLELRERYLNKQQEHEEDKQKLKGLEAFYHEQMQQQQCYVEELRQRIQAAQLQAEQELEYDQEQLKQQIEENQRSLANEEKRLVCLEQQQRELGTQTDSASFSECGVQISPQTEEIPSIEQDRKRLMLLELLQKHSLRKAEQSISKKRVKYQLERIAEKRKLLEAKTNLQHLEAASLLSEDQLKQSIADKECTLQTASDPKLTDWNKSFPPNSLPARRHSLSVPGQARRHSYSNDLVSRLYPQYEPLYSDFLKRKNSTSSSQRKNHYSSAQKSLSVGSLLKLALPVTRKQAFKRGSETVSPAWGQLHKKQKAVEHEEVTESQALKQSTDFSINESTHFISKEQPKLGETSSFQPEIEQVISNITENKNSSGCLVSVTRILESGLMANSLGGQAKLLKITNEDVRQDLMWKCSFMNTGNTSSPSRICKKPPTGRLNRVKRFCKRSAPLAASPSQSQLPIKGASSMVDLNRLWESVPRPGKMRKWHSVEILNAGNATVASDSLEAWSGEEEMSDAESLYSVDSLSSAYANALTEQLQQEESVGQQYSQREDCSESDDSQMSQDSLVDEGTGLLGALSGSEHDARARCSHNKPARHKVANRGKSISLDSLADVEETSDIFRMDSAGLTASDEMSAEVYWNLPWTEGDGNKSYQAPEVLINKMEAVGDLKLKGQHFYLDGNTELKSTVMDKNIELENVEPDKNDINSLIMTEAWSSNRSNLEFDSSNDISVLPISLGQTAMYRNMGAALTKAPEGIWIRPVFNFHPVQETRQHDATCNVHETTAFITLKEGDKPHAENKEDEVGREKNSTQTKEFFISTARTDEVTVQAASHTDHHMACDTEVLGSSEIETIQVSATRTSTNRVLPAQRSCSLMESKEFVASSVPKTCLRLKTSDTDAVVTLQDVDSEMEITQRRQQENTETEGTCAWSQYSLLGDDDYHGKSDVCGSTSRVSATKLNSSSNFQKMPISGTEQFIQQAEELTCHGQSRDETESQIFSNSSCTSAVSNSGSLYRLAVRPSLQVLEPKVLEEECDAYAEKKDLHTQSTSLTDRLLYLAEEKNDIVDNSLLIESMSPAPSIIQSQTKAILELSAVLDLDHHIHSALMKNGNSQSEKLALAHEGGRQIIKPIIMQGSPDTRCALIKGKDNWDLMPNLIMKEQCVALPEAKNQVKNDSGDTSTETLLGNTNNPVGSGSKVSELKTLDDGHLHMENNPVCSEDIWVRTTDSPSQQQSVVIDTLSNDEEERLSKGKTNEKEISKISYNSEVEDCLNDESTPLNVDAQDQKCNNRVLTEETAVLSVPTCGQSSPNSTSEDPAESAVESRIWDGFNLVYNIAAKSNRTDYILPNKLDISAESIFRSHLPFIKKTIKINRLVEDGSEILQGPNMERVPMMESVPCHLETTNPQINRNRFKTKVNPSTHDHKETDVNQNNVAIDLFTVQFIEDGSTRAERFTSDGVCTTNSLQGGFEDYEEICVGNAIAAKLNKSSTMVQGGISYFDNTLPVDLTEDSVILTGTGFLGECKECDVTVEEQVGSAGTFEDVQRSDHAGEEVLDGDAECDQKIIICAKLIQRDRGACGCLEQSKSKENSVVSGGAENVGNNSGTTNNYFQTTIAVTGRSRAAETNGNTTTASVNLADNSEINVLSALQEIRATCTAKSSNDPNEVISFHNDGFEKLSEDDNAEARVFHKGTGMRGDWMSGTFSSSKYCVEQTCTTQYIPENVDAVGGAVKERSQSCVWTCTEACDTADAARVAFQNEISASCDASHRRNEASQAKQEHSAVATNVVMVSKHHQKLHLETVSNQTHSKCGRELQMGTDFLTHPTESNEMLTDVCRLYPEFNQERGTVQLIQTNNLIGEFEGRTHDGNNLDINSITESVVNQSPLMAATCTADWKEISEPASVYKGATNLITEITEIMTKNYKTVKSLARSNSSVETRSRAEQKGRTLLIYSDGEEAKMATTQLEIGSMPDVGTDGHQLLSPRSVDIKNTDKIMDINSKIRKDQHAICEEKVLSFSGTEIEHQDSIKSPSTVIRPCTFNNQETLCFHISSGMTHDGEVRQILAGRYSQNLLQEDVATRAVGDRVEQEIDEQSSPKIPKSVKLAVSCVIVSNNEEQKISHEEILSVIEKSDSETLQETEMFETVPRQGNTNRHESHLAASLCDTVEHSLSGQQLWTSGQECTQGGSLNNRATMSLKTFPGPLTADSGTESVESNLISSQDGAPADEDFQSRRRLNHKLPRGNISQQQLAESRAITDSTACSKDTVFLQDNEQGTSCKDSVWISPATGNIQDTATSQSSRNTIERQDTSSGVGSPQSCCVIKHTLQEINEEKARACDCQINSSICRKEEYLLPGRSLYTLPNQDIVLKEVIGRHVMWCQFDESDFQSDLQATKELVHSDQKAGYEALTNQKQKTSAKNIVCSDAIVANTGTVDAMILSQKHNIFKGHQSPLFLHDQNTGSLVSGLNTDSSPPTFQGVLKILSTGVSQNTSVTHSLPQQCKMFQSQTEVVRKCSLQDISQLDESQVVHGDSEVCPASSFAHQSEEWDASRGTSSKAVSMKQEEKEVPSECRLCIHEEKPIETQTVDGDAKNAIAPRSAGLSSLESTLGSELLKKHPAARQGPDHGQQGRQQSVQEQSPITTGLPASCLLKAESKCHDVQFSHADSVNTFQPQSFIESCNHQKQNNLLCRSEEEDSSVSLIDGDLVGMGVSGLIANSLNLYVTMSEWPMAVPVVKCGEESVIAEVGCNETVGCAENPNDSTNNGLTREKESVSERCEKAESFPKKELSTFKRDLFCSGSMLSLDSHNKNHQVFVNTKEESKSKCPSGVDVKLQYVLECSNKASVESYVQKEVETAASECKSEMHHSDSHVVLCTPVYGAHVQEQPVAQLQQTQNQLTPGHKLRNESKLQIEGLRDSCATLEIAETYSEFSSQESDDLPVIQIDGSDLSSDYEQTEDAVRQCRQIEEFSFQSHESSKCSEMDGTCYTTDFSVLSDSCNSGCSVCSSVNQGNEIDTEGLGSSNLEFLDSSDARRGMNAASAVKKKSQRLKRMKPKSTANETKDSSSSGEYIDIEFLSLKELRTKQCGSAINRSQSYACKCRESMSIASTKLKSCEEEAKAPLLKQRLSASVVQVSSSNVDLVIQGSSGHTLAAVLIAKPPDALNPGVAPSSPCGEEVVYQTETLAERIIDRKHGESKLSLQPELVRQKVSVNTDSHMLVHNAVVHSRVTSPCNRGQRNQSINQQSDDGHTPVTNGEFHRRKLTEGKLEDRQFSEVELSFQEKKDPMHFASSDINPYIHQRQCDELSRVNWKPCAFGSASNVCSVQSKVNRSDNVMRCSSVDNGLNIQNSPFNSHLSSYANARATSDTLSDVSGTQGENFEATYPDSNDLDGDTYQMSCDPPPADSFIRSSQLPSSKSEFENVRSQVDEIVLLYPMDFESSVKSASAGPWKLTCNQETQTSGGVRHQKLSRRWRSYTHNPPQAPARQGHWSSLQNLSVHLSQLLHNTTELLGDIHPNTDRSSKTTSPSNRNRAMSRATRTADRCTQTAVDVAIQTEILSHTIGKGTQENQRKEVQRSPEVNVIVKVIGSDVNVSQEHTNVTLTLQERKPNCSVPDCNTHHVILSQSLCSPSSEGENSAVRISTPASLDAQKLIANSSQVSPGVSPVAPFSQTSVHSDHTQGASISSLESTSEFSKLETNYAREMKSFAQGLCAEHEPASANTKAAVLVDRASSPIETFEAGSGNQRSRSKSFLYLQGGESRGLQHSVRWQRKQRPASWYGFNEKQQRKIHFTHMESEVEQKMEINGGVSLVQSNEQSKFTAHDLSRSVRLESEANLQSSTQSEVSSVRSEAAKTCNEHQNWQCENNVPSVGHAVKQMSLCNSTQSMETEPQLVLQKVQVPCTSNTDGRKQVNASAFQPTYQNTALDSFPPSFSKINDGTRKLSRRSFQRSPSISSIQHGPLSEDGADIHEQQGRTLQGQTRHKDESMNHCNSVSGTSIMSEVTIKFATEDAQSLVSSECNTEVLLNEYPSTTGCHGPQLPNPGAASCRGPEDLPLHNKFCNWSGVHYRPPSTASFISTATSSHRQAEKMQTRDRITETVDVKSEVHEERQKEIESLRQERAEIMSGIHLDLNQHQLTVELTEAKLNYGLGETDALLRVLQSGAADDLNIPIRQQLYDRHMKTIETLRKEREEKLQKFRRTRSLSPQKHLTLRRQKHPTASHHVQDLPSKRRNYLQQLRQDVVENTRTQAVVKGREETPSEIECLLRDYQKAREEAKVEIAKARDKLRARAEKEKCRLQQQMLSQLLKEEERVKNVASRSSLCTGSNLSLSSSPTSGYSSSNTTSPDINPHTKFCQNKCSTDPMMASRGRTASRSSQLNVTEDPATGMIQSFHTVSCPLESVSGSTTKDSSHTASSTCLKKYQDLATHTIASVKAEIMVASVNNLDNLLNGKAAAGWRYHCTEKGILMFYKPYNSSTKHGFLGVGVIEKPLHCVWCMVKDHSKRQLYDKTIKTVKIHQQLGNGIELVYLVNDTSVCYLNQPRDFCCISVEAKEDQKYILAMQSIYEESMPRPVKEIVRGEMLPSGWILQPDTHNGKEITRLIYLTQVDLGAPALPARLLGSVAKRQPLCIANLADLLSC
uniref:uncharacterized protein n=1 Tax=Pristiophorus japonicus TaxID=55135 RepID=UPI00398F0D56